MLPGGIKKASLEDVKKENPELFAEIFEAGKAEGLKEVSSLKEENQKLTEHAQIMDKAYSLGLSNDGKKLISEGKGLTEALISLIDLKVSGKGESTELKGTFEKTTPPAAGSGEKSTKTEPKTWEEAKMIVKENNPSMSKVELLRETRKQFPKFSRGEN